MICPYCQHDLDVQSLSCPRCFAEYPRSGPTFGFGMRISVAAGALLLATSLVLVNCVFTLLPGGSHAGVTANSRLFSGTQGPDFNGTDAARTLRLWYAHQQAVDQGNGGGPHTH
jgi:hypothetical protein